MYDVFFKFYSCNEDIKPSAAFSCRHIKYKIHAPECTKTRHFYLKNSKIFWGGGTAPSPDPSPIGRGQPPPTLTPLGASIFAPSVVTHARCPPLRSMATGLKFLDFSLIGSECCTEWKFHWSESSLYGLFAPGNESAEERKGQIPYEHQFSAVARLCYAMHCYTVYRPKSVVTASA